MFQKIKVLKRDGSLEEFNPEKIARVTQAAGLDEIQARLLAGKVAEWVNHLGLDPAPSSKVKEKVIDELTKINKQAADLFTWYEKTKENNSPLP